MEMMKETAKIVFSSMQLHRVAYLPVPPEPFGDESRNREDTPVNEDANFGFIIPKNKNNRLLVNAKPGEPAVLGLAIVCSTQIKRASFR